MRFLLDAVGLSAAADDAAYALREAESPESAEFVGGHGGFALVVVVVAFVVVLILYLQKEEKI